MTTGKLIRVFLHERPIIIYDNSMNGSVSQIDITKIETYILPPYPVHLLEDSVVVNDKLEYGTVNRQDRNFPP